MVLEGETAIESLREYTRVATGLLVSSIELDGRSYPGV